MKTLFIVVLGFDVIFIKLDVCDQSCNEILKLIVSNYIIEISKMQLSTLIISFRR